MEHTSTVAPSTKQLFKKSKKKFQAVAVSAAAVLAAGLPGIHEPAAAYVAGSAVAGSWSYDYTIGGPVFRCTYSGWAYVDVNFTCRLRDVRGYTVARRDGTFNDGYHRTPLLSFRGPKGYYCVYAAASYANGSDSDSDTNCH